MTIRLLPLAGVLLAASLASVTGPASAQDAATVGTAGSAAAGDTAASTLGTAGTSTGENGDQASSLATGGSAASADGKAKSDTKVIENPRMIKGHSKAMAHDGGTFSKSMTKTKVKDGELSSDTRSMSHVPGEKPVKTTTGVDASLAN